MPFFFWVCPPNALGVAMVGCSPPPGGSAADDQRGGRRHLPGTLFALPFWNGEGFGATLSALTQAYGLKTFCHTCLL